MAQIDGQNGKSAGQRPLLIEQLQEGGQGREARGARGAPMRRASCLAATVTALLLGALAGQAAAATPPPEVTATWVTSVGSTSANLRAEINPAGFATSYRFEYVTETAFLATGFTDAPRVPVGNEAFIGSSGLPIAVVQHLGGLEPDTAYLYRIVASNTGGSTPGPARPMTTREPVPNTSLPEARAWEMVSPVDKNGGEIQSFGGILGGGVLQAAERGSAITYSSASAFDDPKGAPGGSQYVSTRSSSSWDTSNVTLPLLSGSFPEASDSGVPYQLFSTELSSGIVSNGRRCLNSASSNCPVENAPVAGSDAPAGYRNYYQRASSTGSYKALLSSADLSDLALGPEDFELAFAGATPDLAHIVLSTCAALTAGATEVPGSGGECDPAKQNIYEKSGAGLTLINTVPGASLAAQSRAISADGTRVYWSDGANLHLRDGALDKPVDQAAGGGGTFETASLDGSVAFFTKAGHVWRYVLADETATDLTPLGGVQGVLGISDDGSRVYYATGAGIFLWASGKVTPVGASAAAGSFPPTTGTARVSSDGRRLLFVSSGFEPSGYDNRNFKSNVVEPEVYLFTAPGPGTIPAHLYCVSCNPTGERPLGGASIPGASPNGSAFGAYKPRVVSPDFKRVFFDSTDVMAPQDTNNDVDVYEWVAEGLAGCAKNLGCVRLISSGRAEGGATFADASADGGDAYFLTDGSLVPSDPGLVDVYDARVGGGLPVAAAPIPCFGDACQALPPEPEDPTPGSLRFRSSGNLPLPKPKKPLKCKKNQVKKFGKCVKSHKKSHKKKGGRR